jgi:hypothetical protein
MDECYMEDFWINGWKPSYFYNVMDEYYMEDFWINGWKPSYFYNVMDECYMEDFWINGWKLSYFYNVRMNVIWKIFGLMIQTKLFLQCGRRPQVKWNDPLFALKKHPPININHYIHVHHLLLSTYYTKEHTTVHQCRMFE